MKNGSDSLIYAVPSEIATTKLWMSCGGQSSDAQLELSYRQRPLIQNENNTVWNIYMVQVALVHVY